MEERPECPAEIRYNSNRKEADCIEKKLKRENIPPGKREALVYRLSDLENRVIPRNLQLVQ